MRREGVFIQMSYGGAAIVATHGGGLLFFSLLLFSFLLLSVATSTRPRCPKISQTFVAFIYRLQARVRQLFFSPEKGSRGIIGRGGIVRRRALLCALRVTRFAVQIAHGDFKGNNCSEDCC